VRTIEEKVRWPRLSRIDTFFNHLNQYLAFKESSSGRLVLDMHILRLLRLTKQVLFQLSATTCHRIKSVNLKVAIELQELSSLKTMKTSHGFSNKHSRLELQI
jgi:hypothetical protein